MRGSERSDVGTAVGDSYMLTSTASLLEALLLTVACAKCNVCVRKVRYPPRNPKRPYLVHVFDATRIRCECLLCIFGRCGPHQGIQSGHILLCRTCLSCVRCGLCRVRMSVCRWVFASCRLIFDVLERCETVWVFSCRNWTVFFPRTSGFFSLCFPTDTFD